MSSCVGKVVERMINDRFVWLAEKENWMNKNQNGFRKGKSCTDSLVRFAVDIEIAMSTNRNTVAVFLDVNAAYDNVRTSVICDILKKKDCPIRIIKFIGRWVRNRVTNFAIGNEEVVKRTVNKGLPQGGVLSPTLYNIYTSEIARDIDKVVTVLQYADDIVLYATRDRLIDGKLDIKRAARQIERSLLHLGLDLEPSKSNVMVFNNKADRENGLKCRIAGQRIGNVRSVKFLGIIFDSKLRFDRKLTHVHGRTLKAINILRFVCRVTWRMEVGTALMIYKSYVRALIEYGLLVYYPREVKGQRTLERLQNKGVRIAMGYSNSTPINVMTAEAKIIIEDRAGLLARNYWIKITSNRNKELINRMNRLLILES